MSEVLFCAKWQNRSWQNSRWLPSSSWVRMNEFDSYWISLSHIELVWVRVRVMSECFWRNLREDDKVFESKMASSESKMAEFKMAAIIKLSQNEWVKFFFVLNGWIEVGIIQDGCHHQVKSEWISEVFCAKWLNPRFQNSRWLPSSIWVRMHE